MASARPFLALARETASRWWPVAHDLAGVASKSRLPGERLPLQADVSQEAEVRAAVQAAVEHFWQAGHPGERAGIGVFKPLVETTTEEWDRSWRSMRAAPS